MVKVNNSVNTIEAIVSNGNTATSSKNTKNTNNKESFSDLLKRKQDGSSNNNAIKCDEVYKVSNSNNSTKSSKKETRTNDCKEVELIEEVEKDINKTIDHILEYLNSLLNTFNNSSTRIDVQNVTDSLKETLVNMDKVDSNVKELINSVNNMMALLDDKNISALINGDKLTGIESVLQQLNMNLDTISENDNSFNNILENINKSVKELTTKQEDLTDKVQYVAKEIKENNGVAVLEKTNNTFKNVEVENNQTTILNEVEIDENNKFSESNNQSNDSQNENSLAKSLSKDEKILNSLLDGKDTNISDNFALAVNRVQIQNNTPATNQIQNVNQDSMSKDIVNNLKTMVTNGIKEVTVKVNPERLGEISIKIIEDAGTIKAEIKAKSKETYSLLSQQIGDIKKQLEAQNIKIQEVNISIYDEDTTFYKDGQFTDNSSLMNKNEHENNSNNKDNISNLEDYYDEEEEIEDDPYQLNNINMWV